MNNQFKSNGKNGGARPGAGRKPKCDEVALIEKLTPYEDLALGKLAEGVKTGDIAFIRLYMEYRFGKAKQVFEGKVDGGVFLNGLRQAENLPIEMSENGNGKGH